MFGRLMSVFLTFQRLMFERLIESLMFES